MAICDRDYILLWVRDQKGYTYKSTFRADPASLEMLQKEHPHSMHFQFKEEFQEFFLN